MIWQEEYRRYQISLSIGEKLYSDGFKELYDKIFNLNIYKDDKYTAVFYGKSKDEIYIKALKNGLVWISYDYIWSVFESNYHIEFQDIQLLMKDILFKAYNLTDVTPVELKKDIDAVLFKAYNLTDVTPTESMFLL